MNWLFVVTILCLIVSFFANKEKTYLALIKAIQKMANIIPSFTMMLVIVAIVLYFVPPTKIQQIIERDNIFLSMMLGLGCGSIAYFPGFIAFPLCGVLLDSGVKYMVISAFSTTLMMVGIVTFPVEKKYLGFRLSLWRNVLSLLISVVVATITGILYGEIF